MISQCESELKKKKHSNNSEFDWLAGALENWKFSYSNKTHTHTAQKSLFEHYFLSNCLYLEFNRVIMRTKKKMPTQWILFMFEFDWMTMNTKGKFNLAFWIVASLNQIQSNQIKSIHPKLYRKWLNAPKKGRSTWCIFNRFT